MPREDTPRRRNDPWSHLPTPGRETMIQPDLTQSQGPHPNTVAMSRVMTRMAHVEEKEAESPNEVAAVGERYYRWKHRFGEWQYSKTEPSRAERTQTLFWRGVYLLMDEWEWGDDRLAEAARYIDRIDDLISINEEERQSMTEGQLRGIIGRRLDERETNLRAWRSATEEAIRAYKETGSTAAFDLLSYDGTVSN